MRPNGSRGARGPHHQLIPELVGGGTAFGPPLRGEAGEAGRRGDRAGGERAGAINLRYNRNPVTQDSTNPFLAPRAYETLPDFAAIRPEHVEPAIRELAASLSADLARVERDVSPTWDATVEALGNLTEPLFSAWGVVGHLMGVKNSPELRAAHDAVQKDVVQIG